ncbi:MAG: DUF4334 domain-containing protein [Myxococcota bacterium]
MSQAPNRPEIPTQMHRDDALSWFDSLATVPLDFMLGDWEGAGIATDHPMDGLLETYGWVGKSFVNADHVHPLLFSDGRGGTFRGNPSRMPMDLALRWPLLKQPWLGPLMRIGRPLLETTRSAARLRMTEHRGKVSATMCYDFLPIHDVFRMIDEDRVLGLMDYKATPLPFFFTLRRTR